MELAWDPVDDPRVAFYKVYWGTRSGAYASSQQTSATSATITGLTAGKTYFFAAKACDETGTTCSAFSEELSTTIDHPAPAADFTASKTSGIAPLTVILDDNSVGEINSYAWDLGDGNTSTAATAVHTYAQAGTYSVSLTVTGPGGSVTTESTQISVIDPTNTDIESTTTAILEVYGTSGAGSDSTTEITATTANLPFEARDIAVSPEWQRVHFVHSFADPVVIVTSVSDDDDDPVTVRISEIDQTGFSVRLQEWAYQDGMHWSETVGFLVVERGSHRLPNGAWLEADEIPVGMGETWQTGRFLAPFTSAPVLLSSVATYNDSSTVITRLQGIDATRFEVMLQGAENDSTAHGEEMVAYVASEGFCAVLDGQQVLIGKTSDGVTDQLSEISLSNQCADAGAGFAAPPVLLADMQTTNGLDTANLRWDQKGVNSMSLRVVEEQSKDDETEHKGEIVGYFATGIPLTATPVPVEIDDAEDSDAEREPR